MYQHSCEASGNCKFVAMAFGISKGMVLPLMILNFCLYFIAACLAGSILNRNLDANQGITNNFPIGEYMELLGGYSRSRES